MKVGSSFLREAFIRFVRKLGWPEHLYTPHFRVPNFIEETWDEHFDENDLRKKWWMNKGLIAWFEQADDRLKLRVEVGPLHHEDRVRILQALRARGVDVKEQAFEEGRQYTRIYMDAESPTSWEDVDALGECMLRLYKKDSFQSLLRLTNEAVVMGDDGSTELGEPEPIVSRSQTPLQQAFAKYVDEHRIPYAYYYLHPSLPSFVEMEWTQFPSDYTVTEKYWLGYPLIAWFERRNSTVRLIVEVGPLPHLERTRFLKSLEAHGIRVRALAYEEGRLYTRIYSRAVPVKDTENAEELKMAMDELVSDEGYITSRERIRCAIVALNEGE